MRKTVIIFLFIIQSLTVFGQDKRDTLLSNNQVFGAFGASFFGYNKDIKSYFSIYWQTGIEWNLTKSSKFGFTWSLLKFNWTSLQPNSLQFGQKYDKMRYFSFSSDFQLFGRYVFNRTKDVFNEYDKYVEFGLGYNAPYYFVIHKFNEENKTIEKYPNKYNDLYFYTTFYFLKPLDIPLGIKLEYHPFDIIKNNKYPEVSKFRIDILISLFSANDDRK